MSFLNLRKPRKEKALTAERPAVPVAPKKLAVSAGDTPKAKADAAASLFIERPHVSEKATALKEKNCYVFRITRAANKYQVAAAIKALYRVTPLQVRVVTLPRKTMWSRGKKGATGGGKKAYVFLKKGDKIDSA